MAICHGRTFLFEERQMPSYTVIGSIYPIFLAQDHNTTAHHNLMGASSGGCRFSRLQTLVRVLLPFLFAPGVHFLDPAIHCCQGRQH